MLKRRMDGVCYECHTDEQVRFTKTVIHQPVSIGQCGACHLSHGGQRPELLKADAKDPALCISCHETLMQVAPEDVAHPVFQEGRCLECNEVHGSNIAGMLTRKQGFLCNRCHGTDLEHREETLASRHQPSSEGRCSACHNPHKAGLKSLVLAEPPDLCLSCHKELRAVKGPPPATGGSGDSPDAASGAPKEEQRLYVHAPEQIGRCLGCHRPHQSPQASLMSEPIQPLCEKCHSYRSEEFKQAHLDIEGDRIDCRKCHTPHVARTPKLFKNVLHSPFARQECKDCHLVESP